MKRLIVQHCFAGLLVLTACEERSTDGTPVDVEETQLSVIVTDIPEEILCIKVNVTAADYSKTKKKEVASSEVEISFNDIPVGIAEVKMDTYDVLCSEVHRDTQASYTGEGSAVIQEGRVTELVIDLNMVGGLSIATTWNRPCIPDDGVCPSGCNANNDNDCEPICGNFVVENGESCDPCPEDCDDNNPCTEGTVLGGDASTCNLECEQTLVSCACTIENSCVAANIGSISTEGNVLDLSDDPATVFDNDIDSYYGVMVENDPTSSSCAAEVVNDIYLSDPTDIDEIHFIAHGEALSTNGGAGVIFEIKLYDTADTEYDAFYYSQGGTGNSVDFDETLVDETDTWTEIQRVFIRLSPSGGGVPPQHGGNQCTAESLIYELRIFGTGEWGF